MVVVAVARLFSVYNFLLRFHLRRSNAEAVAHSHTFAIEMESFGAADRDLPFTRALPKVAVAICWSTVIRA